MDANDVSKSRLRIVEFALAITLLVSVASFAIGFALNIITVTANFYVDPWLPLTPLEYGFPLGLVVGVLVATAKLSEKSHDSLP